MFHFSGDEMTTSGQALWNHFPKRSKLHFLVHLEHWKVGAQKPVSRSLFSNINTREFMNFNFQFNLSCPLLFVSTESVPQPSLFLVLKVLSQRCFM